MGEMAEHIINLKMSGMISCGKVQDRPDTKGISKDSLEWFLAIVVGYCAREIGTKIYIAASPDSKFYYVKNKKGVGTINIKKVKLIKEVK